MDSRYDRNVRFFGTEGQERIAATRLAVIGVGGLGTHVIQQAALLGFGQFSLVDPERLDETNLNRYIGVTSADVGRPKAELGKRLARLLNPSAQIESIESRFQTAEAFAAVRKADIVVGCFDNDGARLVCTEICAAAAKVYFDLATDIVSEDRLRYGGRVVVSFTGRGCLVCRGVLDLEQARLDLDPDGSAARDALYGVLKSDLRDQVGPAVVSLNGVVASIAVTELMLHATGLRIPHSVLTYRGEAGKVLVSGDPAPKDCYYCSGIFGRWELAGIERYLR